MYPFSEFASEAALRSSENFQIGVQKVIGPELARERSYECRFYGIARVARLE
jgi:hypothetical protein